MAFLPKAWARALSNVFANLCAGWYGVVFIAPNFWPIYSPKQIALLILDLTIGTLCLYFSAKLEQIIEKYE